jgi:hypothetical protein
MDTAELAGYAMHSMIKQIDFEINSKQISNLPQNYAYRAFLEALLGYSEQAKKSHLKCAYWDDTFKTGLGLDATETTMSVTTAHYMMGKIHTDLGFQGRYLVGGCSVKLEINLNDPRFYMKLGHHNSARLILKNVALHIQKAKISKEIVDAHRQALQVSPAKYPITRCEVKTHVIPKGVQDIWIDNFVFGQLPRRIFLVLVENDAFSGSYSKDPFNFKPAGLNHLCAYIDGVAYPSQPYQPNFDKGSYLREYLGLFDALNQNGTETTCTLDKATYKTSKAIFGFNFSNDLSNGVGMDGHANLIKRGTLRLQLKFSAALENAMNVIAYCEFDNVIEINGNGEVFSNIINV